LDFWFEKKPSGNPASQYKSVFARLQMESYASIAKLQTQAQTSTKLMEDKTEISMDKTKGGTETF
jgi:hypothetical protein